MQVFHPNRKQTDEGSSSNAQNTIVPDYYKAITWNNISRTQNTGKHLTLWCQCNIGNYNVTSAFLLSLLQDFLLYFNRNDNTWHTMIDQCHMILEVQCRPSATQNTIVPSFDRLVELCSRSSHKHLMI